MSKTIECLATRRGRMWVAYEPEHGVYGSGRTLRLVRASVEGGLVAAGVTAEVKVTPAMPELEKLRAAEELHTAALAIAVKALALRRATLSDIAEAVGVPVARVRQLLAGSATASDAQPAKAPEECRSVLTCAEHPGAPDDH
ncbi:hypothetical protein ACWD0G_01950 [Streptomyces goshikiensis]